MPCTHETPPFELYLSELLFRGYSTRRVFPGCGRN
nr:MAG TPA: hypothetical protein [Caudoviricetes sp.]